MRSISKSIPLKALHAACAGGLSADQFKCVGAASGRDPIAVPPRRDSRGEKHASGTTTPDGRGSRHGGIAGLSNVLTTYSGRCAFDSACALPATVIRGCETTSNYLKEDAERGPVYGAAEDVVNSPAGMMLQFDQRCARSQQDVLDIASMAL
jgi:hypothetical protein